MQVVECPVYEPDLFSPSALHEPFEHYRAMRDLGPVVRLRDPDVYALARFNEVRDALQSPKTLICTKGTGFSDGFNQPRLPNLLQSDGDNHRRYRTEVVRPLLPGQLKQHRAALRQMIDERIKSLVDRGPFEAMSTVARFMPVAAISEFVGLPEAGRASMLDWAAANFNAVGPVRASSSQDPKIIAGWRDYLDNLQWSDIREGSWAKMLEGTMESGKLTPAEARGMISAYVMPSLDTTILAQGHLLYNLARDPEQWELLRNDPSLIPSAVIEGVRHSSVVRWFSRYAAADYHVGDIVIPEGSRVMVAYAAANRDERHFPDPDRFDIRRDARTQLSWGSGPHLCGGLHLAKLEMEVLLEALVENCAAITAGVPETSANCGLYGFAKLPMEFFSAA